jgi:hypothetical protein
LAAQLAADYSTIPKTPLERELDAALLTMLHENSELKGENAKLQARLDAMMSAFDANGALGVLQKIMHDEDIKTELRIKAASAAVGFERSKPPATVNNIHTLFDTLERAHQRDRELRQANAKTIEHAPTTVLGEGAGEHGAWHPLDSDKGDPAA